ncbi:MAG TPA: hypothetical protein VF747_01030 [Blastocatellia bacterium]|jgi:hypothetical protein
MSTGMHLTDRDRAVIAAQENLDALKAQLDLAIADGTATLQMLEAVQAAQAHVKHVGAMPMKFVCALGKGQAKVAKDHIILHVCAVTYFHADAVHINSDGEEIRGAYQFVEYDKDQLRKIPVCGGCNGKALLHEQLHERAIDAEADPRRSVQAAFGNFIRERDEAQARHQALIEENARLQERNQELERELRRLRPAGEEKA